MKKRFLVRPGYVWSVNDDDLHFITCDQVMRLHNVNPAECICIRSREDELGMSPEYLESLLELGPHTHHYSPVGTAERRAYPIGNEDWR